MTGPQLPAATVAAFTRAVAAYPGVTLPPDVRVAFAALDGCGYDQAAIEEFTALMCGEPLPLPVGHGENHVDNAGHVIWEPGECITCHGHGTPAGGWQAAS